MTASERPGCATSIREAGEVTTEVRLLALPPEPPVESEVEVRSADGYVEGAWFRKGPAEQTRAWTPTHMPDAPILGRSSWRQLCEQTLRYRDCELWLTREGPAEETPRG